MRLDSSTIRAAVKAVDDIGEKLAGELHLNAFLPGAKTAARDLSETTGEITGAAAHDVGRIMLVDELSVSRHLVTPDIHMSRQWMSRMPKELHGNTNSGVDVDALTKPAISKGIPLHRDDGFLENGVHLTTWSELTGRFATDPHREQLAQGMLHAVHDLKAQGFDDIYVGGSYVTTKAKPGDFDITYSDPFSSRRDGLYKELPLMGYRKAMKEAYGGEAVPNLKSFFQQNDRVGTEVGILKLDLEGLPPRPNTASPAIAYMEKYGGAAGFSQNYARTFSPPTGFWNETIITKTSDGGHVFRRGFGSDFTSVLEFGFIKPAKTVQKDAVWADEFGAAFKRADQRRAEWSMKEFGPIADLNRPTVKPGAIEAPDVLSKPHSSVPVLAQLSAGKYMDARHWSIAEQIEHQMPWRLHNTILDERKSLDEILNPKIAPNAHIRSLVKGTEKHPAWHSQTLH